MIGQKLRDLRKSKELTLAELAEKTGFTASYLSQLERDMTEPSFTALRKICKELNIQLYYFLEENDTQTTVTKANERQKLVLPNSSVEYEFVSPMGLNKETNPKVEVIEIYLESNKWSSDDYFCHDADEIFIVIEGCVLISLRDENILLEKGDSIYIKPNIFHKFYNPAEKTAKILSIITPPIY